MLHSSRLNCYEIELENFDKEITLMGHRARVYKFVQGHHLLLQHGMRQANKTKICRKPLLFLHNYSFHYAILELLDLVERK